mgnify:CR=1 FL=1
MADSSSEEKTEKPSAQKLRKARQEGQIPRSKDMGLAASLFAAFMVISSSFPWYEDFVRESFISVHPFEKYSAVEGYKGKCSTNRLPSERSAYMMKINPAKSSGCEDYTIYVKDGKPPEFWSCPFVITLACHYIFVNKHMIFSINKIVMRGNCTGSSSCVSGYKDGSLLRLPSVCCFV